MTTYFSYRGADYQVSGWLWASDGANNGIIVSRDDGRPIRGARMYPGMVQLGISAALTRAATAALSEEHHAST